MTLEIHKGSTTESYSPVVFCDRCVQGRNHHFHFPDANFKDHPMPESIGIYWGLLGSFEIQLNPAFFVFFFVLFRRSSLVGHGAAPAKPITLGLSARGAAAGESSGEDGHGGAGLDGQDPICSVGNYPCR